MPKSFAACTFKSISRLNDGYDYSSMASDLKQIIKKSNNADELLSSLKKYKINGKKLSITTINNLIGVKYKKYI
jgi:hypothetical protein